MKLFFLSLLFFVSLVAQAQFKGDNTVNGKVGIFTSAAIFEDGLNYGLKLNFNFDNGVYVSPEIYYFPDLHDNTYLHTGAGIGYNVIHNENWRLYSGVLLTFVKRDSSDFQTNGSMGFSFGIDYKIKGTPFFIGVNLNPQYRTDHLPRDPNFWVISGFAEAGIILF